MPKIKLVIFDAGDVLYDWSGWLDVFDEEIRKFSKKHSVKFPLNHHEIWDSKDIGKAASVGRISLKEAHRRHLKAIGLPENLTKEYHELDKKALRSIKPKDRETRNVLLELKKKGYKIAVLSDTPHTKSQKEFILELVGLDDLFDEISVSSEIGHTKPNKEAYLAVLNYFRAKPSEVVFVAHDKDELVGAKKLGIKTISYQGHESGDFVIQGFEEILDIVEKLNYKLQPPK